MRMLEFDDKEIVGEILIPQKFTANDIANIIVSSLEGGSNYWMGLDNSTSDFKVKPEDEPLAMWVTKLLLDGKTVKFYDREEYAELRDAEREDEAEYFELTLKKLLKGIKLNAVQRPFAADKENWDAGDADCIMQYALFRKIVFG